MKAAEFFQTYSEHMQDRPKNLEVQDGSGGFPHHWMRGWPSPQKGCRDFLARWATSRFGVEFGSAAWLSVSEDGVCPMVTRPGRRLYTKSELENHHMLLMDING